MITRLSERTLERLRVAGTGPRFAKLGRRVVYRQDDINRWVASRVRGSTSEGAEQRAELPAPPSIEEAGQ